MFNLRFKPISNENFINKARNALIASRSKKASQNKNKRQEITSENVYFCHPLLCKTSCGARDMNFSDMN